MEDARLLRCNYQETNSRHMQQLTTSWPLTSDLVCQTPATHVTRNRTMDRRELCCPSKLVSTTKLFFLTLYFKIQTFFFIFYSSEERFCRFWNSAILSLCHIILILRLFFTVLAVYWYFNFICLICLNSILKFWLYISWF